MESDYPKSALVDATVRELLDELGSRFDAMIFAGRCKIDGCYDRRTTGSTAEGVYMAEQIKFGLLGSTIEEPPRPDYTNKD